MRPPTQLTVTATVTIAAAALAAAVLPAVVSGDMTYALVWGRQLAEGELTSLEPGPTPHPLAIGFGALFSVLGTNGAYVATEIVFGFMALGVLVGAAFDIAWRLSSALGGAAAALLAATSTPILMWTAQAGYDLAFAALALAALALEVARPRRGWFPLSLLVLAGLLRPEAWLLAAAYWLWLWPSSSWWRRGSAGALVILAPAVWIFMDAAVTGNPLWSLQVTGEISEGLVRGAPPYSPGDDLVQAARDVMTIVGPLALPAAAVGGVALWRTGRPRAVPVLAVLAIPTAGFVATITLGGASSPRYLLLPGAVLVALAAVAAGRLPAWRRTAAIVGLVAAAAVTAQVLVRWDAFLHVREQMQAPARWIAELQQLGKEPEIRPLVRGCRVAAVPSPKLIGPISYFTGRPPQRWTADDTGRSEPDVFIGPAHRAAARAFMTHRRYVVDVDFRVPPGMTAVARTGAWSVHLTRRGAGCADAAVNQRLDGPEPSPVPEDGPDGLAARSAG